MNCIVSIVLLLLVQIADNLVDFLDDFCSGRATIASIVRDVRFVKFFNHFSVPPNFEFSVSATSWC